MPATPEEIARRAVAEHFAALPSAELLRRYATCRDPSAFAGLVRQFGPMVLGTCRRVLGPSADVDDAFQAVFLSLARQAGSFRDAQALPAWLHRVSLRIAHKALGRRSAAGAPPETVPDPADPFADVAWKDVRRVLDEELDALPDKYRGPVILCWLDGLTQDEAAGQLGVSLATLKRRLDAGRELLRARLVRRGVAPVVAAAAVLDATGLRAVVPDALAVLVAALGAPSAARLSPLAPTAATRFPNVALALVLVAGAVAAGVVGLSSTRPARKEPPKPEGLSPLPIRLDIPVAPLPPGAVAQFGATVPHAIFKGGDGAWQMSDRYDRHGMPPTAVSPDGKSFAVRTYHGVAVFDVATWRQIRAVENYCDGQHGVSFSPDGSRLVATMLDPNPAAALRSYFAVLELSTGRLDRLEFGGGSLLGFAPDGTLMRTGAGCFDLTTRKVLRPLPSGVWDGTGEGTCASPDRTVVAAWESNRTEVSVWRAGSWDARRTFRVSNDPVRPIDGVPGDVLIAEDNRSFAVQLKNGELSRWDLDTERELPHFQMRNLVRPWSVLAERPKALPVFRRQLIRGYHVLPDGRHALTPCEDGTVRLWDTTNGHEVLFPGHYHGPVRVRPSGDGRYVVLADKWGQVDLLDAASGRLVRVLRNADGCAIGGLAINRAGSVVAFDSTVWASSEAIRTYIVTADGTTISKQEAARAGPWPDEYAWDDLPRSIAGPVAPADRFSLNQFLGYAFLATGDAPKVRVTDTRTGQVRNVTLDPHPLGQGHEPKSSSWEGACVSPDGNRLLWADVATKGSILLGIWDIDTGRFVANVPHPGLQVSECGLSTWFTPDGNSLMTFGGSPVDRRIGFGYRWDLEKLIAAQKK